MKLQRWKWQLKKNLMIEEDIEGEIEKDNEDFFYVQIKQKLP